MNKIHLTLLAAFILFSFGYVQQEDAPSKIYLLGNTLIRTDPGAGISLHDISNPANPALLSTIDIEDNSDVAATGDVLYADRGYDLIIFDISDPANPVGVDTIRRVFNYAPMIDGFWMGEDVMVEESGGLSGCGACSDEESIGAPVSADAGYGVGGSLARFVIVGDILYCVDTYDLIVFDISEERRPVYRNRENVGWDIETIFHDGENLFIGSRSGVYIFSVEDPEQPEYLSEFRHATRCDPVVVEGDRAYVTLRGGNSCGGHDSQMDILDISDLRNPRLLTTYELSGPYGLGVREKVAVICDGEAGVRILDTSDPDQIRQVGSIADKTAHDVILYGDLMILTAEEGFFLYNISDIENPSLWSELF